MAAPSITTERSCHPNLNITCMTIYKDLDFVFYCMMVTSQEAATSVPSLDFAQTVNLPALRAMM